MKKEPKTAKEKLANAARRGQPPKPLSEVKSEKISMRMTVDTKKLLLLYYGSVQTFFDLKVAEEKSAKK